MKNVIRIAAFAWVLPLLARLTLATLAADTSDVIKQQIAVTNGGRLILRADRGFIDVTNSMDGVVAIEVQRKAKGSAAEQMLMRHQVDISQSGNDVRLTAALTNAPLSPAGSPRLEIRFLISIPRQFHVDLQTSKGGISVQELDGDVRAVGAGGNIALAAVGGHAHVEVSDGSIRVGTCGGGVTATASAGNIKIGECAGDATVETAGGNIDLAVTRGTVKATTSGGSIRVREAARDLVLKAASGGITVDSASAGVDAESSAGPIQVGFSAAPTKDSTLLTAAGAITVYLPASAGVSVDAQATGGAISSDFPMMLEKEAESGELRGTMNGGGNTLKLEATGGGIRIRKRVTVP
jgi:DUF4097 and DUF4098 domain-containing protein YvlB